MITACTATARRELSLLCAGRYRGGKFPFRNAAEDPSALRVGFNYGGIDIAHHQQMRQRFIAVTVDPPTYCQRAPNTTRQFYSGRGAVSHHVALLGAKGASDILFRFQMRAGMVSSDPPVR